MTLWGGRFTTRLDPAAWALNASLPIDRRLAEQDVRGSLAWAEALSKAGVLSAAEAGQIRTGLEAILIEFREKTFAFQGGDEDIHSAVERRLGELIGALAGKLHTGRSRNDQVATDFRLWMLDVSPALDAALKDLQSSYIYRAETDLAIILPGYTHLQRAQPILLAHFWLAHFWPLERDRQRLGDLCKRTAVLPLGSGALAGVPFAVDRPALAQALGFREASPNSIDAVSDRDFAAEFLFCAALIGSHLSRLAEDVILYSSAEFGYLELADSFSTGSSLMPQKKNPDPFELARAKAGTLLGYLSGLLAVLKGLPSAYDKDLQEDKAPVFEAFDTLLALLPVMSGALRTLQVKPDAMRTALEAALFATDLADYLVENGMPFRQAHAAVGEAVRKAQAAGVPLDRLPLAAYREISASFDEDLYQVFDPQRAISRRAALGGTAPAAVAQQLVLAKAVLAKADPA